MLSMSIEEEEEKRDEKRIIKTKSSFGWIKFLRIYFQILAAFAGIDTKLLALHVFTTHWSQIVAEFMRYTRISICLYHVIKYTAILLLYFLFALPKMRRKNYDCTSRLSSELNYASKTTILNAENLTAATTSIVAFPCYDPELPSNFLHQLNLLGGLPFSLNARLGLLSTGLSLSYGIVLCFAPMLSNMKANKFAIIFSIGSTKYPPLKHFSDCDYIQFLFNPQTVYRKAIENRLQKLVSKLIQRSKQYYKYLLESYPSSIEIHALRSHEDQRGCFIRLMNNLLPIDDTSSSYTLIQQQQQQQVNDNLSKQQQQQHVIINQRTDLEEETLTTLWIANRRECDKKGAVLRLFRLCSIVGGLMAAAYVATAYDGIRLSLETSMQVKPGRKIAFADLKKFDLYPTIEHLALGFFFAQTSQILNITTVACALDIKKNVCLLREQINYTVFNMKYCLQKYSQNNITRQQFNKQLINFNSLLLSYYIRLEVLRLEMQPIKLLSEIFLRTLCAYSVLVLIFVASFYYICFLEIQQGLSAVYSVYFFVNFFLPIYADFNAQCDRLLRSDCASMIAHCIEINEFVIERQKIYAHCRENLPKIKFVQTDSLTLSDNLSLDKNSATTTTTNLNLRFRSKSHTDRAARLRVLNQMHAENTNFVANVNDDWIKDNNNNSTNYFSTTTNSKYQYFDNEEETPITDVSLLRLSHSFVDPETLRQTCLNPHTLSMWRQRLAKLESLRNEIGITIFKFRVEYKLLIRINFWLISLFELVTRSR